MTELIDTIHDIQNEYHEDNYAPSVLCIFTHPDAVYEEQDFTFNDGLPEYTSIAARINGCAVFTNPRIPPNYVIAFHPIAAIHRKSGVKWRRFGSEESKRA